MRIRLSARAVAIVFCILLAELAITSQEAAAQTVVPGGNIINQTWTPAGSPYRVMGDITVPAGAFLDIAAGTTVEFAGTDAQASGLDLGEVELTVVGSLHVTGTAAQPVTMRGFTTGAGAWYGVVVDVSATEATFAYTTIAHAQYGVRSSAAGTALAMSNTTIHTCSQHGLYVAGGSPAPINLTVYGCNNGVYVEPVGAISLTGAIVRSNSNYGVYVGHTAMTTADSAITGSTVYGNSHVGIWHSSGGSTRALRVRDSVVTDNASYGIYKSGSASTLEISYSNVWNNSSSASNNINGSAATTSNLSSANPLYVAAPTNLRITSNSPARFAAMGGGDIGALPYTGDLTVGLVGTLWDNTTLPLSGSPYSVPGDLTVAPGRTLTLEPGVIIRFATTDTMRAGDDLDDAELRVIGTLAAVGTAALPILLESSSTGVGAWWGVRFLGGTASSLDNLTVMEAQFGLWQDAAASHSVQRTTVHTCSDHGVYVRSGTLTADVLTVYGCVNGVYVEPTANLSLTQSVVRSNSNYGIYIGHTAMTTGDSLIDNTTVYGNSHVGIWHSSGGSTRFLRVRDSVVTDNASYGIYKSGSASNLDISYSNVWNNSSSASNNINGSAATTSNVLSANPLYVAAPTNLRITSNSPARFAAMGGGDIGALPYTSDPTVGLVGTLWTNTTLALTGSPFSVPGDLTVAPNVTLTLEPGVIIRFATTDSMRAGDDLDDTELRIAGTLMASGTAALPILLESSSTGVGAWWGVKLLGGTATTIDRVTIMEAQYGIWQDAAAAHVLRRSTIHTCSDHGLYNRAGGITADAITIFGCVNGVFIEPTASATLTNAVVRSNSNYGIYIGHTAMTTADTTITNATVYGNSYVGIWHNSGGSTRYVRVRNSIVTSNASYGIYKSGSASNLEVTYSDLWGNSSSASNNLNGSAAMTSNLISANPLYVAAPADLHLTSTSVAIDAGTNGAPADADGVSRPLDGNGIGGAQWDLGAYEFVLNVVCGNGAVETGEACDSGANNGMYGYCNASCTGLGARCGDSMMNGPEQCDDGNASNTDACLNTCVTATCGDGYTRAGTEACDDGNLVNTDACLNTCAAATCGDGYVRAGVEPCDDGNASNTDACLAGCVAATCGDGFVRAGVETCDDMNLLNTDACLNTCTVASCGDGFIRAGVETCDDGNMVNTDACVGACVAATCGDGYIRSGVETCDDGNTVDNDACRNTCMAATCGDGVVQAGSEECDDANMVETDACRNSCMSARCGDGVIRAGVETCDDGNTIPTDACTATCAAAVCGDGITRAGVEECDDANLADTDACVMGCVAARCGDGFTRAGVEGCDDGNMDNTDACTNACVSSTCGDGVVQAGTETCDDMNTVDTDACRNNCALAACGDGVIQTGVEDCDDSNTMAGDGCSPTCETETVGPDAGPIGPDAGTAPGDGDGGGGCCSASRGGRETGVLTGLLLLAALLRRRRPARARR